MMIDDEIRACFPHPTFRPGQLEFIREAITALDGGAKNIIVEAPTGTGKTPAIITIARYYTRGFQAVKAQADDVVLGPGNARERYAAAQAILAPHQAHMITSLKMLQDQYLRDDKLVQIMKGKGNYMCHSAGASMGMSCSDHELMFGSVCQHAKRSCTYVRARQEAQLARLTLHNFDSFLNQVTLGGSFPKRAVLTIDEAHGADARLISSLAFEIHADMLRKLDIDTGGWRAPAPDNQSDVVSWLYGYDGKLKEREEALTADIAGMQNSASGFLNSAQEKQLAALARRKNTIGDMRRRINRYLASAEKVPWAVEVKDNGAVNFEPVRSSFFAKSALLDFGERRVFMSATIFDKGRRLMAALNLKPDETHYIAVPCIFPVAGRPLVDLAVADTGAKGYNASRAKMFDAIRQLLDRHAGQRGVIHCNSYQMAKDIVANVRSARLMTHESATRDSTVNAFMTTKKNDAVLVGVFLREGYDFKDDLARFQVIARLPYAWPDKRTKMRDEMEKGYYDWLCAIDLVQTYGRGVRNEKDYCTTYCLDNRLKAFLKRAGHMIPEWFKDAVVAPGDAVIVTTPSEPEVDNLF